MCVDTIQLMFTQLHSLALNHLYTTGAGLCGYAAVY